MAQTRTMRIGQTSQAVSCLVRPTTSIRIPLAQTRPSSSSSKTHSRPSSSAQPLTKATVPSTSSTASTSLDLPRRRKPSPEYTPRRPVHPRPGPRVRHHNHQTQTLCRSRPRIPFLLQDRPQERLPQLSHIASAQTRVGRGPDLPSCFASGV